MGRAGPTRGEEGCLEECRGEAAAERAWWKVWQGRGLVEVCKPQEPSVWEPIPAVINPLVRTAVFMAVPAEHLPIVLLREWRKRKLCLACTGSVWGLGPSPAQAPP